MRYFLLSILSLSLAAPVVADVSVPSIFGSNMILQQKMENKIWGWGHVGDEVTVSIAGQTKKTTVQRHGDWELRLDPMAAGFTPHQMVITGPNTLTFDNVLVGEVWICSGQSNMAWPVAAANDADLEMKTANYPNIRLISVPQIGTQEPQRDFKGEWAECSPETVRNFSAVGYYFGRQLHQTLNVPIGLIDNAWGGSGCEAWIRRDILEKEERYKKMMDFWKGIEQSYESGEQEKKQQVVLEGWKKRVEAAKAAGKTPPGKPRLRNEMTGNHRPANIYNGVLKPTIGYGIRGAIWYQGESNAGQAHQYRDLFPLMIKSWRQEWQQGEFPFYWVQLADFRDEFETPGDSSWAELREAQTMTMDKEPNTGEAVIVNLGEANDIHPTNKVDVAKRLARWALAKDYGIKDLAHQSPRYESMEKKGKQIVLTFAHTGRGLDTVDVTAPLGFTIAGEDQVFHHAKAQILGRGKDRKQIKIWCDAVENPVAVRYAWADNPVCNVRNYDGLPLTPFRTDDWKGMTQGVETR